MSTMILIEMNNRIQQLFYDEQHDGMSGKSTIFNLHSKNSSLMHRYTKNHKVSAIYVDDVKVLVLS